MPRMTGKQALAQMLLAEGVEYIFGNPGTSETPTDGRSAGLPPTELRHLPTGGLGSGHGRWLCSGHGQARLCQRAHRRWLGQCRQHALRRLPWRYAAGANRGGTPIPECC